MNYPFWDVPHIGSGWVIGLISIFHVMISHFAVGGGLYLPMAEAKAQRERLTQWRDTLKAHSKFFLILTGVFGAVSGVGIWFAIGLAHPEATSTLIHNFVFGWAIEWVFFMVELTAAAVYYYTWDRVSDALHLRVGWLYAVASMLTLVIINGILTFMLTSGDAWLAVAGTGQEASRFWQAFFNPTYWPSLFLRVCVCISLAGVWALVTGSRIDGEKHPETKEQIVRWSANWLIPSFVAMPFLVAWLLYQVPEAQRALLALGMTTAAPGLFTTITRTVIVLAVASVTIVGVVNFFAMRAPRQFGIGQAVSILFLAVICTASGEYTRELLRKPYVINRHMYSNGVRKSEVARFNAEGYLTKTLWVATNASTLAKGEAMFRGQCLSCHTRDAYRPMKRLLEGRNRESIGNLLAVLHDYKEDSPYRAYMPPLVGRPEEIEALGDYLATLIAQPEQATNQIAISGP